jgi:hypothetical protein
MGDHPWPQPFVGSHILISEPAMVRNSWDNIPEEWKAVRFDAVDVLFIGPFEVLRKDHTFALEPREVGSLEKRFEWVVRAARTQNPNIKIIPLQWWSGDNTSPVHADLSIVVGEANIHTYAESVAKFLETWYPKTLPATSGSGTVSARLDGWDVDVEGGNRGNTSNLPAVLKAVHNSLQKLSSKLSSKKFSVSITPDLPKENLNDEVAKVVDYVNMMNYDGGSGHSHEYKEAMPHIKDSQLAWGLSSESPNLNELRNFAEVVKKVHDVASGLMAGIWTWRLGNAWENEFQVWLYNQVHQAHLSAAKSDEEVKKHWENG